MKEKTKEHCQTDNNTAIEEECNKEGVFNLKLHLEIKLPAPYYKMSHPRECSRNGNEKYVLFFLLILFFPLNEFKTLFTLNFIPLINSVNVNV
jgi:hypothetical protein